LPINILDQRLLEGGYLDKLKKYNVEIHARSVFLQGLLLMPLDSIHTWFNPILDALKIFHVEATIRNISTLQLALGFVQNIDEIDKIVIGVNTLKQLEEIINVSSMRIDVTELCKLSINDPIYLNPSNWEI